MNELVSVIIPVYNVERYLDGCVESVVNQTYDKLEIILVDDGSTDQSGSICDEWAKKDLRIRTIHKKNGGLSDARNAGLDICKGEYLVFVDSDDFVEKEFIQYLHKLVVNGNADIAVCPLQLVTPDGIKINNPNNDGKEFVFSQEQALWHLCNGKLYSHSSCGKIFSKRTFQLIRFPTGRIFEDMATTYKLFLESSKVVFGRMALYNYVRRKGSIMTSDFDWRKMDALVFAEELCKEITAVWPSLADVAYKNLFYELIYIYKGLTLSNENSILVQETRKDIYRRMRSLYKKVWRSELSKKTRLYVIFVFFGDKVLQLGVKIEDYIYKKTKKRF